MWVSKLQTEIALYTLHAEYLVLSQTLRYMLPLKVLSKESIKGLGINTNKLKVVT